MDERNDYNSLLPENNLAKDIELEKYTDYLSVGELLDFIEKYNIDRKSKVLVQRVEDIYYNKHNWTTLKKAGDFGEEYPEEYTPVFTPVKYPDDSNLFLNLHY